MIAEKQLELIAQIREQAAANDLNNTSTMFNSGGHHQTHQSIQGNAGNNLIGLLTAQL